MPAKKGKKLMTTVTLGDNKSFTTFIEPASSIVGFEPHPSVQRGLDNAYANSLKKKLLNHQTLGFAPLGTILTIQRDGVDYVFDGQHRLQAIKNVATEKEGLLQAYESEQEKKAKAWDEFHQRVGYYQSVKNAPDADSSAPSLEDPGLDEDALKKTLGLDKELEPLDTEELDALLSSPVVVVRYTGDWTENELKELFTSYNMGKRVSSNLLTKFASSNETIVGELDSRGWFGKYIEDKGGKNKCLFGVGDVCRFAKQNGEVTTLVFLEELFKRYDVYDAVERGKLEPLNLYSGWSRCLGVSVRALNAVSKLIPCINTESDRFDEALAVLANAAQALMADPVTCSQLLPGSYNRSTNGFVQASNTVVEGLLLVWFTWHLKAAGFDMVIPKVIMNRLMTADEHLTELVDGQGVVTPIFDAIEVFSTLAPKPKVKAPSTGKGKSKVKAVPSMVTPDLEKEDLTEGIDLDPNAIAF